MVEESLRLREFPGIEFRDTAIGRQAYLRGTRLALWQLALLDRDYRGDVPAIAEHLCIREEDVALALGYIQTYREEIDAAIKDIEAAGDRLAKTLPLSHVIEV